MVMLVRRMGGSEVSSWGRGGGGGGAFNGRTERADLKKKFFNAYLFLRERAHVNTRTSGGGAEGEKWGQRIGRGLCMTAQIP